MTVRHLCRGLELVPGDVQLRRAGEGQGMRGETPAHQPVELNRALFDGMAEIYDQHIVRGLGYRLPKIVADRILERYPEKHLNVLDLGCGTGLLGVCLGRLDGFLISVEISQKMIEQAVRHKVYDKFHTVDLTRAVLDAHRILQPAGDFWFSCEIADEAGPELALQANGRYAHKRSHVASACRAAGFESVEIEELDLRREAGVPVRGILVRARKAATAA